jgi:hypothetical protein
MHINGRCSIDGSSSKDLTGFVHGAGTTFLLARYPLSFSKAQEIIMLRAALAVATLATASVSGISDAQAQTRTQVGVLTCNLSSSLGLILTSQKGTACVFDSQHGFSEHYVGVIRRFGLDIGATSGGILTWAVFAAGSTMPGALAGNYTGATAEATVGAGLGANVLVGGSNQSIALQPLSVSGQTGLNFALGVGNFELRAVR